MKQCRMDCIHIDACRRFADNSTYWNSGDCPIYKSAADVAPKSEVAREIFEEIEKIIDKHHSECYEYEDGDECDTAITYISYISCDIAELKNKYTEGKGK